MKGFATIAAPLHALTQKATPFHWTNECQHAFEQLKDTLTSSPVTAFPDFTTPFRLYTDASTEGLGAILAQKQGNQEKIICCASRSLNQAEKNYPATKLECLAIVWAVEKFRPYLMSMPFEIFTDHYALQWLRSMRTGSSLLHRWAALLEEYTYTIRHRPGKSQTHVDGLSRLPVGVAPPEDQDPERVATIREITAREEAIRILEAIHATTHLGTDKTWRIFQRNYSHPGGRKLCQQIVKACHGCQMGSDYRPRTSPQGHLDAPSPWDTVSVDIVGPLPYDQECRFIATFVDCFSRYTILVPLADHTAPTVCKALYENVIAYFGVPRRLLSDRGREFTSELCQELLEAFGIRQVLTSPYHPQGNAINERSHRTLNNILRATLASQPDHRQEWVSLLPGIMMTLNTMPHTPHNFSANMLLMGRESILPPDLIHSTPDPPRTGPQAQGYVDELREQMQQVQQQVRATPPSKASVNPFQVGELIWVATSPSERAQKLSPRWSGPHQVLRTPNPYQVIYGFGKSERTTSVHLAKHHQPFTNPYLPLTTDSPPTPLIPTFRSSYSPTPDSVTPPSTFFPSRSQTEGNTSASPSGGDEDPAVVSPLPEPEAAGPGCGGDDTQATPAPEGSCEEEASASSPSPSFPSSPSSSPAGVDAGAHPHPMETDPHPHTPTSPPAMGSMSSLDNLPTETVTRTGRLSKPPDRLQICHNNVSDSASCPAQSNITGVLLYGRDGKPRWCRDHRDVRKNIRNPGGCGNGYYLGCRTQVRPGRRDLAKFCLQVSPPGSQWIWDPMQRTYWLSSGCGQPLLLKGDDVK